MIEETLIVDKIAERQRFIDGLRELASYMESQPDLPTPILPVCFDTFTYSIEEFNAVSKALGGFRQKEYYPGQFVHRRMFGPIQFDVNINREKVCERVVVGTKIVPAVPEREEEIIEWRCHETGDAQ